jgi:hypothetical protein
MTVLPKIDPSRSKSKSASVTVQWIARIRSIRLALDSIYALPEPALFIMPFTRSALLLTQQLAQRLSCRIVAEEQLFNSVPDRDAIVCSPAQLVHEFADSNTLPHHVICFPEQLIGYDPSYNWIPFLESRYLFSILEALLCARHHPAVFGLCTVSSSGDFRLAPIPYADYIESHNKACLTPLMIQIFSVLEKELRNPPSDWLGAHCLARKSEAFWRGSIREQLKDIECLLRLQLLQGQGHRQQLCEAIAAVVNKQKQVVNSCAL